MGGRGEQGPAGGPALPEGGGDPLDGSRVLRLAPGRQEGEHGRPGPAQAGPQEGALAASALQGLRQARQQRGPIGLVEAVVQGRRQEVEASFAQGRRQQAGALELGAAFTGLVIGSALLMLSALWQTIRRAVVGMLGDMGNRLPPVAQAV